jgi:hypothetical protein
VARPRCITQPKGETFSATKFFPNAKKSAYGIGVLLPSEMPMFGD